jgi:hypothetical protein
MQRIAGSHLSARVQIKPSLTPLRARPAVPRDIKRLKAATWEFD